MSIQYNKKMDDKEYLLKLAFVIRYARTKKGYSQEQLAEQTGLSSRTISSLERGEVNIGITNLHRIAEVLGLDLGVLNTFQL